MTIAGNVFTYLIMIIMFVISNYKYMIIDL